MFKRAIRLPLIAPVALMLVPATAVLAQSEYSAMEGAGPIQVVYDFRVGDPAVANGHLNLIHSMLDDPAMTREGEEPEIAVVFIGPSVGLLSTEADAYSSEVAETIAAMEEDGVTFEICMTSAHALDVGADTIVPEVVQVGNGWISLAGYQENGYAMIADF